MKVAMESFLRALFFTTLLALGLPGAPAPGHAQGELRGHGGPVRALSISGDGREVLSGSFDSSAIIWSLEGGVARAVLRAHAGGVNAVLALPGGRFVTGGEDGRLALWGDDDLSRPLRFDPVHGAPIAALSLSPDGALIASGSWDSSVALTSLAGAPLRRFEGHQGNVNGVAFSRDGRMVVSAGYDATLRLTLLDGSAPRVVKLPSALNALAISPSGDIATGAADGSVFLLTRDGVLRLQIEAAEAPVIALAFSPDGMRLAAASPRGGVGLFDVASGKPLFTLNGPGLPVWSLGFTPDGRQILTGGSDRLVRRWDARTGDHLGPAALERPADPFAGLDGSRGAEVFRACVACHTLRPDGGERAGPTLHGVIGRRIGGLPGYAYSPGFAGRDITWSKETIARLFELGPAAFTPGTKMPEQRVTSPEDRAALVDFIEAASRP